MGNRRAMLYIVEPCRYVDIRLEFSWKSTVPSGGPSDAAIDGFAEAGLRTMKTG